MKYQIGEIYWATYKRGWQCPGELVEYLGDDKYLMYSKRHGYYIVTEKNLDDHN